MTLTEPSAEATSRTLATPKGDLHYHEAGEGPPLVLCTARVPGSAAGRTSAATCPRSRPSFPHARARPAGLRHELRTRAEPRRCTPPSGGRVPRRPRHRPRRRSSATRWAARSRAASPRAPRPGEPAGHPRRCRHAVLQPAARRRASSVWSSSSRTRPASASSQWMRSMVYDPAVLTERVRRDAVGHGTATRRRSPAIRADLQPRDA